MTFDEFTKSIPAEKRWDMTAEDIWNAAQAEERTELSRQNEKIKMLGAKAADGEFFFSKTQGEPPYILWKPGFEPRHGMKIIVLPNAEITGSALLRSPG